MLSLAFLGLTHTSRPIFVLSVCDDDDIYLATKPGYQKGHKPINAGCPYKKYFEIF